MEEHQKRRRGWLAKYTLEALAEMGCWATPSEVSAYLRQRMPRQFNYDTLKHTLYRLAKAGEIQGEGDGIYAVHGVER